MNAQVKGDIDTVMPIPKVTAIGKVTPPADMKAAALKSLSPEGYTRLMMHTGGRDPTPAELCREVEFEKTGAYPRVPLSREKAAAIAREAYMLAVAMAELTPEGFKALMHSIDWRAPTPEELCAKVDEERANGARVQSNPP